MKHSLQENVKDYSGILIGAVLFGIAYSWFLFPFRISPGGIGGLAQILYHFTGIRESLWMFGFNIPLFVLGYLLVGKQFGVRSLVGVLMSNAMCWVFDPLHLNLLPSMRVLVHNIAPQDELPRFAVFLTGQAPNDILLASIAGTDAGSVT